MMKQTMAVGLVVFCQGFLAAEAVDIDAMLGADWYGLYINGQKAGFSCSSTEKDAAGNAVIVEDARFRITMSGAKQDMQIYSKRVYRPTGELVSIYSKVVDAGGAETVFDAHIVNDEMVLVSDAGGAHSEQRLPKPKESLSDALKYSDWVKNHPAIGDTLTYTVFEPMYQKEVTCDSKILAVEERVFDGVPTPVYKIETVMDLPGIRTLSYVSDQGTTLEDHIADIITSRLEPEDIAKNVNYSNDVIVSNAAILDTPIENPRTRDALHLILTGPLDDSRLFTDERQTLVRAGDRFDFTAKKIVMDGFTPAKLPIADESVKQWLEPTVFVQSGDPKLIAKAKEIVGDEQDSFAIVKKLCGWVNANMHSTYSARLTNALEVLDSLEGDCTEHSILFIGLARAAGIPAREVAGVIYVQGGQSGFYFHQWAKAWVGKWIDVDPTFNQPLADVTHIKLAEGDLLEQARIMPIIGNLKIQIAP